MSRAPRRGPIRIADDIETRGSWLVELAIGLIIGCSLVIARPVFGTDAWLMPGAVLLATVLTVAALVRSLTASSLAATLSALGAGGAGLWIVSTLNGAGSPFDWGSAVQAAVQQVMSDTPPLRESPGLVLVLHALIVIVAVLVDLLALGATLGTGALSPVLLILAIPLVASASGPVPELEIGPLIFLALAFAFYLVTTQFWRRRIADAALADEGFLTDRRGIAGIGGAVALTAVSVVAGIVALNVLPTPVGLPLFRADGPSSLASNRVNPIIDLGDDLRRPSPVNVFQYATTTTSGELPYFSLVTLSDLPDGESEWRPRELDASNSLTVTNGSELPRDAHLDPAANPVAMTTGLVIQRGTSAYLPVPGSPRRIDGLQGDYVLDAATGDLREQHGDAPSQVIEVHSELPLGNPQLAAGETLTVPPDLSPYTKLPTSPQVDAIQQALDGASTPGASPYERAREVQEWLAKSGTFHYSLTAPVTSEYDGSNLHGITAFLEAKSGYCVHFASTMAVMARLLGIPSRIVVGFTPGQQAGVNGDGQTLYQVSSNDLHAWAELYVPNMGWVPYEATPADGVGTLQATDPNAEQQSEAPVATETVTATPSPSETPTGQATPEGDDPAATGEAGSSDTASTPSAQEVPLAALIAGVLIVAALVLALCAPALRRILRLRRLRGIVLGERHEEALTPGMAAWLAVSDRAAELRLADRIDRLTPARGAARLGALLDDSDAEVHTCLKRLQQLAERARYARPERRGDGGGAALWADVERVREALAEQAGPAATRRALFIPATQGTGRAFRRLRKRMGRRG